MRNLLNINQKKLKENFDFLKKEVEEFRQRNENLNCENKRLEYKIWKLKYPNDAYESIIALHPFNISKRK